MRIVELSSTTLGVVATRTSTRPRVRLEAEDRRSQLIELGLTMLATQPLDRVGIEEIAAAAGISRGLLFHYFASKRDFHLAVAAAAAAQLLEVTDTGRDLPPLDRLRSSLEAYVGYVAENEALYVGLVRGAAGADPELQAVFDANRATFTGRVLDALGQATAEPALRVAARGWVGFVEESTLDWLRHGDLDRSTLIAIQEDVLVHAVSVALGVEPSVLEAMAAALAASRGGVGDS